MQEVFVTWKSTVDSSDRVLSEWSRTEEEARAIFLKALGGREQEGSGRVQEGAPRFHERSVDSEGRVVCHYSWLEYDGHCVCVLYAFPFCEEAPLFALWASERYKKVFRWGGCIQVFQEMHKAMRFAERVYSWMSDERLSYCISSSCYVGDFEQLPIRDGLALVVQRISSEKGPYNNHGRDVWPNSVPLHVDWKRVRYKRAVHWMLCARSMGLDVNLAKIVAEYIAA